ncbi:hypothetical protein BABINDRAFT_178194 [Babjeviella inositovora NRRL Y-12698]|uniref:RING-type domain-containing protein n=1 Tax=Babjeviella inositovora NRRL Y-12698 TaxID=984486 RepID=A0A1E3QIP4_9ASCO|nr:uncharacterized protein BABINDRAFT_178194 [Babjeviella inositovora NRRL Y-12698]ODQ77324.1 hypothetical protein BABINDRAFT_178194 [Babjeviella inositovora NRRL Y-12698]
MAAELSSPGPTNNQSEDCTICLEGLYDTAISNHIGRISTCGHIYHAECIKSWSDRSSSCPTCRLHFQHIDILDHHMAVYERLEVKDKFYQSEDVLNEIPEEFINPPDSEDDSSSHFRHQTNDYLLQSPYSRFITCTLCDSQSGSSMVGSMVLCDGCSGLFHVSCLGLEAGEPWFCPMCDSPHEGTRAVTPNIGIRRSRNSILTHRIYEAATRRNQEMRGRALNSNPPGFDALPSTPLSSFTSLSVSLNGFTLLSPIVHRNRYEPSPPPRKLTKEETNAWEQFDKAKDMGVATEPSVTARKRQTGDAERKFKRPSRRTRGNETIIETGPSTLESPQLPKKSLVSSILSEMKANSSKITIANDGLIMTGINLHETNPNIHNTRSLATFSPPGSPRSPEASDSDIEIKLPDFFGIDAGFQPPQKGGKMRADLPVSNSESDSSSSVLTYENKKRIQENVRDVLRPLYKDGKIDFDKYTAINKTVSRKLYKLVEQNPPGASSEGYWQKMADKYTQQELQNGKTI